MAAPSSTVWGSVSNSRYRLGIYTAVSTYSEDVTVYIEVWLWSRWSLDDSNNTLYFDTDSTSATTARGSVNISHTDDSSWSTGNQSCLGSNSYSYTRTTSRQTIYCAATLSNIGTYGDDVSVVSSYDISPLVSYTVSYVANGGTGAPSAQVKWYGKDLTLSSTKPVRTGYTFLGWSKSTTATSPSYQPGDTFTENANTNLYAVWEANGYKVTYDANGGTGAPSYQNKTHDVDLTLSSAQPTRENYIFKGWGVSASSTTVSYAPGATYTANAAITLYAIWELAYMKPRISDVVLTRSNSEGVATDDGTYFNLEFVWATDEAISSITVEWKPVSGSTWSSSTVSATGTSGTVSQTFGSDSDAISTEYSYNVRMTVADDKGSTTVNRTLPGMAYTIDFLSGGKGVAIGKPAEIEALDIAMPTYIEGVRIKGGELFVKGTNTIASTDDDIVANWLEQGTSLHWYNASELLNNQPTQYGYLLNVADGSNVHQLWFAQPNGYLYHRGGNSNTFGEWVVVVDENNVGEYGVSFNGGTVDNYTILANAVNSIGYFRLHNEWLGFYGSSDDAQNNANRKGWTGFDGSTVLCIINEVGESIGLSHAPILMSDIRLKQDIADAPEVFVDIWKELIPKIFRWNDLNNGTGTIQLGLIAQDVIEAFGKYGLDYRDYGFVKPFTLENGGTEYFGIAYDEYHMMTAMVAKKHQEKIDSLEERIKKLEELILGQEE